MTDHRSARILVIDDEVTQRILVKEYLEEAGYVVRLSDDGRRGLKMAAATKPDLIILDLMLPSMDGYTLCTCLKQAEATANIPIILITASREAGVIDRGLAAGADDFVTKPVDWAFLADRVKMVLARAQQQRAMGVPIAPAAEVREPVAAPAPTPQAIAEVEARAAAEIERIKSETQAELRAAAQRHAQAFEAAKSDLRAEAKKAAEEARQAALSEAKIATAAERDAAGKKHAEDIARLKGELEHDLEAVKTAAKSEIARIEHSHSEMLAAVRADAESKAKAHFTSQFSSQAASEKALQEKHAAEIAALQASASRQLEALRHSFEVKLASSQELQQQIERLEADLKASEERHQSEALALSEAASRDREALRDTFAKTLEEAVASETAKLKEVAKAAEEKLAEHAHCEEKALEAEADFEEKVRSCWEFSRAASVAHLDTVSEIIAQCRSAGQALASGDTSVDPAGIMHEVEHLARGMSASLGKLRMLAQIMSGGADFRDTIFDFGKLVSDAVGSVKETADQQKVSLGLQLPDQPVVIRADHARLSYAVVSVLANALRFTPQGGAIGVSLKIDGTGSARLEIADSGVGMAPVMLDSLRTCLDRPGDVVTGAGDGVGFGVPVVTALVRQHGGHIEIESGLGRGTEFAIVLPLGKRGQSAASSRGKFRRQAAG